MIAIISPSLTMEECSDNYVELTLPKQLEKSKKIVNTIKKFTDQDMKNIMKINDKIYESTKKRYHNIKFDLNGSPAISTYTGTVYKNINSSSFNKDEIEFCRKHIRILSGLYGILNPYDSIYEHRIEFKMPIYIEGRDLYKYFGDSIYNSLISEDREILNLCSNEYSKAIVPYLNSGDKFVNCSFKVNKNGVLKTLSVEAKKARGKMVNYIVRNKINTIEELKYFNEDGYEFRKDLSNDLELVFSK